MVLPVLFLCSVFVYVTVQLFKHSLNFLKHTDSDKQIRTMLKNTLAETSGERLIVMKFRSLSPEMDFAAYTTLSCAYEAYKQGYKPVKKILGISPAAMYIMFLKNLQDGYVILDPRQNGNEITEAACDRAQDESKGLFLMLNDKEANPFGYLCLRKVSDFANGDLKAMTNLTAELSDLINTTA